MELQRINCSDHKRSKTIIHIFEREREQYLASRKKTSRNKASLESSFTPVKALSSGSSFFLSFLCLFFFFCHIECYDWVNRVKVFKVTASQETRPCAGARKSRERRKGKKCFHRVASLFFCWRHVILLFGFRSLVTECRQRRRSVWFWWLSKQSSSFCHCSFLRMRAFFRGSKFWEISNFLLFRWSAKCLF